LRASPKRGFGSKLDFARLRRQFDGGVQENFEQSSVIRSFLVRNAFFEERLR